METKSLPSGFLSKEVEGKLFTRVLKFKITNWLSMYYSGSSFCVLCWDGVRDFFHARITFRLGNSSKSTHFVGNFTLQ